MTTGDIVPAIVLIKVPAKQSGGVVRSLTAAYPEYIAEAAAVYGEIDVIARLEAPIHVLHELVAERIQSLEHVTATEAYLINPELYRLPSQAVGSSGHNSFSAFVLIKVPAGHSESVIDELSTRYASSIAEIGATYAGIDVVAKVETPSFEAFNELIMNGIQKTPYVTVTRTYVIIPMLHEFRDVG